MSQCGRQEEGLNIASVMFPDLILSDIRMPRMDGLKLLEKLQENPETSVIPVVMLTAKIEAENIREGMRCGADDYLTKPFKAKDVLESVSSRLRKKENYYTILEEARNSFVKNVPHELRTPLISILGFSEMMEQDSRFLEGDDIKEIAHRINRSGKRLHRRIEKLIKYGYLISLDKKNIKTSSVKISKGYISKILISHSIEENRIQDVEIKADEAEVRIDDQIFQDILSELFENALKFSGSETPVVIRGFEENNYYVLIIEDNGEGINIRKIEESGNFNKIDPGNENREGMGLGLAIVKEASRLYGISISFESEVNKYTRIKLSLPLAYEIIENSNG